MTDRKVTDLPLLDDVANSSVYAVKDGTDYQILSGSLITEDDAPSDGSRYVRQNGSWITGGTVDSVNGETGDVTLIFKTVNGEEITGNGNIVAGGVTSVNSLTGDIEIVAGTNVTITSDGVSQLTIKASVDLIKIPEPISPASGAENVSITPVLVASEYGGLYGIARLHREFQVDYATGDFSSPVASGQINADSWQVDIELLDNTEFKWRCRDVNNVFAGEWSIESQFTTYDIYVATPSITKPTPGGVLLDAGDPITASAFSVINASETHAASYWEIYTQGGGIAHSSGRTTTSLTSYQPPLGVILGAQSVRVRYESNTGRLSDWSPLVNYIGEPASKGFGKYLSVAHTASPQITNYGIDINNFVNISPVGEPLTGNGMATVISPNGDYMVVLLAASPYIAIYKRDGDTFTRLPSPENLPTGNGLGAAFSPDSNTLVVSHVTSPFITIYSRSGDTFTKIPNPATLPTGDSFSASFSPSGSHLAVTHLNTPFVTIYSRSGNTFTKLPNPSVLPTGSSRSAAFSQDGNLLVIGHLTTPYMTVYSRSGNTFTKLNDPTSLPTGIVQGVAFSPNGTLLATSQSTSPYINLYSRSGNTLTKLSNPSVLPAGNAVGVSFSADGTKLAVAHANTPFVTIYSRSGNTFTKLPNPSVLPTGNGRGVEFWPNARYPS